MNPRRLLSVIVALIVVIAAAIVITTREDLPPAATTLTLAYTVEGRCTRFSTDGQRLMTERGVFDATTGDILFNQPSDRAITSRNGRYVSLWGDGIYDVDSSERIVEVAPPSGTTLEVGAIFSPDDTLVYAPGSGVYETASGASRFAFETDRVVQFSPDSTLFAVAADSVYDAASGEKLFDIGGLANDFVAVMRFSEDGSLLFVRGDNIYDTATGETLLDTSNYRTENMMIFNNPDFDFTSDEQMFNAALPFTTQSPDGSLAAIFSMNAGEHGVYDTTTHERLYGVSSSVTFSTNSTLIAVFNDAVYDARSGEQRFEINEGAMLFSPDSTLLAIEDDGVFDVTSGDKRYSIVDGVLDFSSDGRLLTLNGGNIWMDGSIYDVASGRPLLDFEGRGRAHFSPDGQWVAAWRGFNCDVYRVEEVDAGS